MKALERVFFMVDLTFYHLYRKILQENCQINAQRNFFCLEATSRNYFVSEIVHKITFTKDPRVNLFDSILQFN